jgi:pseudouridine kinase
MNLPEVSLAWLTAKALAQRQRLVVLAVSEPKMLRLPQDLRGIDTLVLNQGELAALATHQSWTAGTHEDCAAAFGPLQAAGLQRLVVTQGRSGVRFIEAGQVQSSHLQPELVQEAQVRDVSGAGDAFCAGLCASYLRYPQDALSLHVQRAMRLAVLTVQSEQSVNPAITTDLI